MYDFFTEIKPRLYYVRTLNLASKTNDSNGRLQT